MTRKTRRALAYFRTSSLANVGEDRDTLKRQKEAVETYAAQNGIEIVQTFYDAGVSGSAAIDQRPAFVDLLKRLEANGIDLVLTENPDRFARDLLVQIVGHDKLKGLGVELIPVSAPNYFLESTPTAELIRGVLGAVSQFERAQLVNKLRVARDRRSEALGRRCEGRKPVPQHVVLEARRLARRNPRTGKVRSYRQVAAALASKGLIRRDNGRAYGAESIKRMLTPKQQKHRARA
jgi:DNA invertase Pin-like site-specific DNA recombinase